MYIQQNVVNAIKLIAKQKNISITNMLKDCDLNKNTLSSMTSRGSWLQANSLAKIADYLDCSVDYLLGRCTQTKVTAEPEDTKAQQLLKIYYNLSNDGQSRLLEYAIVMDTSGLYSPKNSDVSAG